MRFANRAMGPAACRAVKAYDNARRALGVGSSETGSEGDYRKILMIKLAGLGDTVLMLPAIHALRARFPQAQMRALVSPLTNGLLCGQPGVDGCAMYDFFGTDRGWRGFLRTIRRLRRERFDLVVDFEQHFGLVPVLAYWTGAPTRVGFVGANAWRGCLFTHPVSLDGSKHMQEAFLDLAHVAGADAVAGGGAGRLWIAAEDRALVGRWLADRGVGQHDLLVTMHPGSGPHPHKRWAPENFAALADKLVVKYAALVVLTGGPGEIEIVRQVAAIAQHRVLIAAAELSVGQVAALIERSGILISNDTGPMHIGPAVGTRTVGLFGPELPLRYRPYGAEHVAVYRQLDCSPCINIHQGAGAGCTNPIRYLCMKLITVENVWREVQSQLETVLATDRARQASR
jgi:heptosyltransferase-2